MDEQVKVVEEQTQGTITFANEVISTIVGIAACDIEGVAGMCGGFKDGIVDLLGKKNLSKGVMTGLTVKAVNITVEGIKFKEIAAPTAEKNAD